MTVEEELKALIISRYSSVRAFALHINMPYSTIDTIFKRGVINAGIDNIMKICNALAISVDALADGHIVSRVPDSMTFFESKLILDYRSLNADGQRALLDFMRILCGNPAMLASTPPATAKKAT